MTVRASNVVRSALGQLMQLRSVSAVYRRGPMPWYTSTRDQEELVLFLSMFLYTLSHAYR